MKSDVTMVAAEHGHLPLLKYFVEVWGMDPSSENEVKALLLSLNNSIKFL